MADVQPGGSSQVTDRLAEFLTSHRFRRLVVACSGGSDSVALVAAASSLADRALAITVVHVNHGLRGAESEADSAFVKSICRRLGVPCKIFRRPVRVGTGNVEEMARDTRYQALFSWASRTRADMVLTGHTRDDQAETVMMNLLRGCSPDGLVGMLPIRTDESSGVRLGRPWLSLSREDLRRYLKDRALGFREDSSNRERSFLRNYLRLTVFKSLERRSPGFRDRLARLASLAQDDATVWDQWTEEAVRRLLTRFKKGTLLDRKAFSLLPVALQRRLLRRAAGRDLLTFDGVERLRLWIHSPPSNGRVLQLRKGWVVERLSRTGGSPSSSLFWFHGPTARRRSRLTRLKQRTSIHG